LEKIRAQKEWKGSKVHANGLRTEEEESSSIVKSATKLENRKKFEQVDRGLVENSGQSNRKDFVRSTRQLTLSSLKASTIADPFESTPSTRKNIFLFKSRQLQLDENEQTRSLSCLTIPQHLGLSPAKKKNLRSPSPTQQTQSKDQSFFCQTGFNHHARPPSRSTQSIQQRTDRTERNRANYQPPNNIWNDVRQKRQTTFESVPNGTIGSSLQSKTERFASFLF